MCNLIKGFEVLRLGWFGGGNKIFRFFRFIFNRSCGFRELFFL